MLLSSMFDTSPDTSADVRRFVYARCIIAIGFGIVLPLVLFLALGRSGAHITVLGQRIDISEPVGTVLNPLSAVIVLASWTAGLAAELLVDSVERGGTTSRQLRELRQHLATRNDEWVPASEFDEILLQLRSHHRTLEQSARATPDLFLQYYRTRLTGLCRQMRLSATSDQLPVNQMHFDTTDILMSCLTGEHADDLLAVHFLRSNAFLQDVPHAQRYLHLFEDKVKKREIQNVRRLFIVDDEHEATQLGDEFSQRYISFHANADYFDYRILPASTYHRFLTDSDPYIQLVEDFGVYGPWYVYETAVATAQAIQGTFAGGAERIETYRRHFKRCWDAGRPYEDFGAIVLSDVSTADHVYDPFFRERHRQDGLTSPIRGTTVDKKGGSALKVAKVTSTSEAVDTDEAIRAVLRVLEAEHLCALATVSPSAEAHINTCFFAYRADPLALWILTPPTTQHGSFMSVNTSVACAIYSTAQTWAKSKVGLQLRGRARQIDDNELAEPLATYTDRYPELLGILPDKKTLVGLESRFYEIAIQQARLFDEPTFGTEVWVDLEF